MAEIPTRAFSIAGRRTSMRLEDLFYKALAQIGKREEMTPDELVTWISERTPSGENLTRAVRVFCLAYVSKLVPEEEGISLSVRPEPRQARHPSDQVAVGQRVRRRA
jgi:predicted DNA-binding ribbon-helix-helix protein